jgi:hypothetical protein
VAQALCRRLSRHFPYKGDCDEHAGLKPGGGWELTLGISGSGSNMF